MDRTDAQRISTFVVERYWPGVSEADFEALDLRLRREAEHLAREAAPVRYLGSYLVVDDDDLLSFYAAGSAQVVAAANEVAGVPFDRIVRTIPGPSGSSATDEGAGLNSTRIGG